jgi:hypothetical protein
MSPSSFAQRLANTVDAFEWNAAALESEPEQAEKPVGLRLWAIAFAVLVLTYQGRLAVAEIIQGQASDEKIAVSWEYDLEQGTGEIVVRNLDLDGEGDSRSLHLVSLLPRVVENVRPDWIRDYKPCPDGSEPPGTVFARLSPGEEVEITFRFCQRRVQSASTLPPCLVMAADVRPLDYGITHYWSGTCLNAPVGSLAGFVSVRPVECEAEDRDRDGDVDLNDFLGLQAELVDPGKLPCYDLFYEGLTGPR